jgi:hypothetical protein
VSDWRKFRMEVALELSGTRANQSGKEAPIASYRIFIFSSLIKNSISVRHLGAWGVREPPHLGLDRSRSLSGSNTWGSKCSRSTSSGSCCSRESSSAVLSSSVPLASARDRNEGC